MKNPFEMHGIVLSGEDTDPERRTTCWLCNKDDHLYINNVTFQWDCKRCGESGNLYTFLNWLIEQALKSTKLSDYARLSIEKSIPVLALKGASVCRSPFLADCWLLPAYNSEGKLANVYIWSKYNNRICATSSLNQCLYLANRVQNHDTIIVAEGHWDAVLWSYLMLDTLVDVVGVPGAGTIPKSLSVLLSGKNVIAPFDNDKAGRKGIDKLAKITSSLAVKPKSLEYVLWPDTCEIGFDLRDLYVKLNKSKDESLMWFYDNLATFTTSLEDKDKSVIVAAADAEGIQPEPCESFDDLCDIMESLGYRMFKPYRDALATMLSVVISTRLLGPMLWIYVVGPSGIGKTMLCDMLSGATEYVKAISKFHGLLSGWNDGTGGDSSLLPLINHKTLVVKDLTAVLTTSEMIREKLFGEMRDAYDGYAAVHYGNAVSREYTDVNFGFIAGVTDVIKSYNNTDLGERFLHIDLEAGFSIGDEDTSIAQNRVSILDSIVMNQRDIGIRKKELGGKDEDREIGRAYTYGFLNHIMAKLDSGYVPRIPPEILARITSLATLIAAVRTKVKRHHSGELAYKPRQESAFRTARQLKKMVFAVTILYQLEETNEEIWALIKRIGLETAAGSAQYEFNIVRLLAESTLKMSCPQLSEAIGLSLVATRKYLNNLKELGTVVVQSIPNGNGQKLHKFGLAKEVKESWSLIFKG